ncbi:MAG TPA: M28 family peptidase, partial [Patescibacteria group bacterium]|nr:M28 family peptidase [Patescibacteria group bacterium]
AMYIASQMQLAGLYPGGAGGGYLQRVPMVGVETQPDSSLSFSGAAASALPQVKYKDDDVLWTETQQPLVDSEGEMIFVGHGVVAPEFSWDDYKGQDVAGKVLLMLVDDPPSDDPAVFGGKARTIYGRWTYKYEIAAKKGAIGALLIHTDASAGYGWQVVRGSWARERAFNELDPNAPAPLKQAGWMTESAGRALLKAAGQDLDALIAAAARPDFKPISLGVKSKAHIVSKVRRMDTSNVIGYIQGNDPVLKDQAVVVTAHYDHLGIGDPDATGDRIFNGAYDNASGVATMLELARAMNLSTVKCSRTLVFIGAAAEEMGLRGSEFYANHPSFPPGKIAANLNLDGVSVLGVSKDMTFLGGERSTLWNYLQDAAGFFGFTISPDAHPEQGSFYRSDHYNFAKIGVPAVSIEHGQNFEGHDAAWGEAQWKEYNEKHYHQPSDEFQPTWDLSGARNEAMITFYLAWRIANAESMPTWKPGDEFAAAREAALKAVGKGSK